MRLRSNMPLCHRALSLGNVLATALCAGFLSAVAGCPGPEPHAAAGGSGGEGSSSSTSSSSSSSTSSSSSSSSTSSSSTTSSGAPVCPDGEICVESGSDGWDGPFQVSADSAAAGCPVGTSPAVKGGTGVTALPATCHCDCGPPTMVVCGTPKVTVSTDSTCSSAQVCATLPLGNTCTQLNVNVACATGTTGIFADVTLPATGGACTVNQMPPMLPPAQWTNGFLACAPDDSPMSCGGGSVCAPANAKLCIAQAGDLPCPAGPYVNRKVIDTHIDDTRSCSACTCTPGTAACKGNLLLSTLAGCSQITKTVALPVDCSDITAQAPTGPIFGKIDAVMPLPPAACAAEGGTPTGGVTSSGPMTLCCL